VQGVDVFVGHGPGCADHRLRQELAAEDPVGPARAGRLDGEAIAAAGAQVQRSQEVVQRRIDGPAENVHSGIIAQPVDLINDQKMLQGEKILITGPAGRIAHGITKMLAADNEVWGIARFSDTATRAEVEALGVTTRAIDLGAPDFGDLPSDFTYLLHIAADFGEDYERALRVNAEGTGLLLSHCRTAKAALVMSTLTVYKPHPDPFHPFREDDPIGDQLLPHSQPYSIVKIAEEAVARYCAREFGLPVTIARMGSAYGDRGGLPLFHLQAIASGNPVVARWDPLPYSPIHYDDINAQVEALLSAASVPATIVNWAGDVPVTLQEWSAYFAELLGVQADVRTQPVPGASVGSVSENPPRLSITGRCTVDWKAGFRELAAHYFPGRVR
jgi:nucleoside-diphosphate-sugar epimerase